MEITKTEEKLLSGGEILSSFRSLKDVGEGALYHHERYDGTGYPEGLKGTDIPEEARIIAVADAYDAMSSRRSYHSVFAQEYIKSELKKGRGTQFDPEFADIMLAMVNEDVGYTMVFWIELAERVGVEVPLMKAASKDFTSDSLIGSSWIAMPLLLIISTILPRVTPGST